MMATQDHPQVKATNVTSEEAQWIAEHAEGLSDSTKRAKWIHSPDEKADRDGQTLASRSHEVIRHWAEERGGRPATVRGSEHEGHPGVLRIIFAQPGSRADSNLEEISWDDWFRTFDARELVFLFQDPMSDGTQSNFFQLDSPNRENA
jgi:hypothetical protein